MWVTLIHVEERHTHIIINKSKRTEKSCLGKQSLTHSVVGHIDLVTEENRLGIEWGHRCFHNPPNLKPDIETFTLRLEVGLVPPSFHACIPCSIQVCDSKPRNSQGSHRESHILAPGCKERIINQYLSHNQTHAPTLESLPALQGLDNPCPFQTTNTSSFSNKQV